MGGGGWGFNLFLLEVWETYYLCGQKVIKTEKMTHEQTNDTLQVSSNEKKINKIKDVLLGGKYLLSNY